MGAIRALRESGVRVPEDVSVVGFGDIQSAAFQSWLDHRAPAVAGNGRAAAEILLKRINRPGFELHDKHTLEPELVIRETTGPAPAGRRDPAKSKP